MPNCTLKIIDQVNIKFDGLDPGVRRKISEKLKFFVPWARHTPTFKLKRWDGMMSLCSVGGATYLNLLDRIYDIVQDAGYHIDIDDQRPTYNFEFPRITEDFLSEHVWPEGHVKAGESIVLRDYQVGAVNKYFENPTSIQCLSTGAGKTLVCCAMSKVCEKYGRTLVIVPSKSLVEQTEEDYRNIGLDVGVFFGDRKETGNKHIIATWQSLAVLSKNSRNDEDLDFSIHDLLKDMIAVISDEAHGLKATELKDLMAGPLAFVPLRWGMTGTIPKEDYESINLLAMVGPVVGEITAAELQEKGVLATCDVEILQLQDSDVEFATYQDEHDYLVTDPVRLAWIADYCGALSLSGNTLILVTRIETGEQLAAMIPESIFISGKVKNKDRKKEYKEVQTATNKIIVASYGVAAVGINIPRIFNLVLVEPGKSFVRVIQSVGRSLRMADDKDHAKIIDLCSSAKFAKRHLTKRKQFYEEAGYPFEVKKVKYR